MVCSIGKCLSDKMPSLGDLENWQSIRDGYLSEAIPVDPLFSLVLEQLVVFCKKATWGNFVVAAAAVVECNFVVAAVVGHSSVVGGIDYAEGAGSDTSGSGSNSACSEHSVTSCGCSTVAVDNTVLCSGAVARKVERESCFAFV